MAWKEAEQAVSAQPTEESRTHFGVVKAGRPGAHAVYAGRDESGQENEHAQEGSPEHSVGLEEMHDEMRVSAMKHWLLPRAHKALAASFSAADCMTAREASGCKARQAAAPDV